MSVARYDGFTRLMHWVMALLILSQFVKFVEYLDGGEEWFKGTFGPFHGSVGFVILVLAVIRIIWSLLQCGKRPALTGSGALAASIGHKALYAGMLALPLTGIFKLVGNGWGLNVFGTQLIARGGDKIEWMASLGEWHSPLSWALAIMVVGHIVMGLVHQFVLKDGSLKKII